MVYVPTVWVDDDGSNQVGTEFTAEKMNKIEQGIVNAGTGGGGGGGGVALRSAIGTNPMTTVNVPNAVWTILPFTTGLEITSSDGSPDFTRTAAGALIFNKAGTYEINAQLGDNTATHPAAGAMDTRLVVAAPGKATPDVNDPAFATERGITGLEYNINSLSGTVTVLAGSTLAALVFQACGQVANGMGVRAFGVTLAGGVKGDKGDTGGNATVPIDPWHNVGAVGEPALLTPWTHVAGETLRFRKDPLGRVWIEGQITGGTGQVAFTLPVGYRPTRYGVYDSLQTNGIAGTYVAVNTNGDVAPAVGNAGYVGYIDISFDTGLVTAMPTGPKGDKGDTGGNATVPMEAWHTVGQPGEPAFVAPYAAYQAVGFRKDPLGWVHFRGLLVTVGSAFAFGSTIFTLPVGFRPSSLQRLMVEVTEPGNQKSICQLQVQAGGAVILAGFITGYATSGSAGTYIAIDELSFDTETVAAMPTGPQGPQGIQGIPGNSVTVPMGTWHTVGAVGEPAFQSGWVNYDPATPLRFRKDVLGNVRLAGAVKSGTVGGPIFTLPAGFRPAKPQINLPVDALGAFGNVVIPDDGRVILNVGANGYVFLDSIEFDTETVTQMPTGPQGPKGDPGTGVFKTLNWNTALAPGFYYGGNFGLEGNTANSPGDPLNVEDMAGIVTINGNSVVQRVWTITTQRAWTRYRTGDLNWTPWAQDLAKPAVYPEPLVGGITPQDGDERYVQTADMASRGEMWTFRYRKLSALASKWEFVGGAEVRRYAASASAGAGATNTPAELSFPCTFGGVYDVEWGARMYQNPGGTAGNILMYCEQMRGAAQIDGLALDLWTSQIPGQTWTTVAGLWRTVRFTCVSGDTIRIRTTSTIYNGAIEQPSMKIKPVCITM